MEFTEVEKISLLHINLTSLRKGEDGVMVSEEEFQWMLDHLVNEEKYEDCALLRDNKDKICGPVDDLW